MSYESDQEIQLERDLARERRQNSRTVNFPLELETTFVSTDCFAMPVKVFERKEIELNPDTPFYVFQEKVRSLYLRLRPQDVHHRSFSRATFLKYANGTDKMVVDCSCQAVLRDIMALGTAKNPRKGDFAVRLVSRSREMSLNVWESVENTLKKGLPAGERDFLLRHGYYLRDRPSSPKPG